MTDETHPTPRPEDNETTPTAGADDVLDDLDTLDDEEDITDESVVYDDDYDDDAYDDELDTLAALDEDDLSSAETAPLDFDIDAALAAVGTLDSVMSEQAAREEVERERLAAERRAEEEYQRWAESYQFPRPGMTRVQTGRPVSLIPALGLMAVGLLLTFGGTLNLPLTPALLAGLAVGLVGLSLVVYWLAAKRWARGALALGLAALGGGVLLALPELVPAQVLPPTLPWMVLGVAVALVGLLARPFNGGLTALGTGLLLASVVLLFIPPTLPIVQIVPVVLGAVGVLMALPLVLRPRRR
ncbi:MAG: hypothetical protein MUF38_07640 [Anaerolineae bacterium]|jgi:hypothetical protein|nr:hypothetical protein [Anaerolineae bacterium]